MSTEEKISDDSLKDQMDDLDDEYETESEEEMEAEEEVEPEPLSLEQEGSSEISMDSNSRKAQVAERKKLEGNEFYKQKKYKEALQLYTEAIDLCPTCAAYYGNRSATYMMLSQYNKALEDARQSVQIDPTFIKGHLREAKCHLAMGEAGAAVRIYQQVLQIEPTNAVAKTELNQSKAVQQYEETCNSSLGKDDFRRAVFCMDRCIELSPDCRKFKIIKAECLALLKRYQESQEICNDILRMDSLNADAVYVRGLCLYYQDNVEKAYQHFQQVLRLAPDHAKARAIYKKAKLLQNKKEEGNNAFRSGRYEEARKLYTEALEIDPLNVFTNSKLYNNRATVSSKMNKLDEAIADCTKAIELDDGYIKAYMRRAKCYLDTEQFDEAVRDYEKIYKLDKSRENKRLLQDAKLELKKSKRKDYYKILGCSKEANEDEIKKAYKKRALLHHPDRHSNASEAVRKEEEKKFKEIGEAYAVLSDTKKKKVPTATLR